MSHALHAAVLPGSVLPEQVSRALTTEEPVGTETLPPIESKIKPTPTPGGEEAKKIKFKLNGIILEGNVTYSDATLRPLYRSKLYTTISIADLFEIVQSITNYYRNNGYIISRAILPPQHVKNGVVKVKIIEGFLDKVEVTGDPKGARCWIKALGYQIQECRPLYLPRMEHFLIIANRTPATSVKAVLAPSKTKTGAADLSLVAVNKPITGYLSYDNYGTRYIGPQQMTANFGLTSFIASGDAGQITFTKTPKGKELTYLDVNYNLPINDDGVRWFVGGTRVNTHPLFVLQPVDISGLNANYYTSLQFPMIRKKSETFTLLAGFNYLDSGTTTFDQRLYMDHVRSAGLGASYNFSDRFYGSNIIYADVRQGLPIMGYSSNTNPFTATTSRPGGHANYNKIDFQASRLQAIKGPFSVYGVVSGQYAFCTLLASEQYAFGGPILGRGYDVAEMIGDNGLAGSIEPRFDLSIPPGFWINALQFYIFYDIGAIWNIQDLGGIVKKDSGTSTGIGVRFFTSKYVSGNLMWTQVLTKPIAAEELIGRGKNPRVFFSIVASL